MEGQRQNLRDNPRFERAAIFELVNMEDLDHEERAAVDAALKAQTDSVDTTYRVGVAMVSEDGTLVFEHNETPGPDKHPEIAILDKLPDEKDRRSVRETLERGIRSEGHAEMRTLNKLYRSIRVGEKKLKIIALAGALAGEPVISQSEPYAADTELEEMEWMKPCGKCLEYIHDRTANVPDVKILSVAATGQVMRTSLRSLVPNPHTSMQVRLDHFLAPEEGHSGK